MKESVIETTFRDELVQMGATEPTIVSVTKAETPEFFNLVVTAKISVAGYLNWIEKSNQDPIEA